MTPKITDEQRQAIHEAHDAGPVSVMDPVTNTTYILVRADLYEQMQGLLGEFDPREAYPFVDNVMRDDDANDPTLASYQDESTQGRP